MKFLHTSDIRIGHIGTPEMTSLLIIYTVSDLFLSSPSRVVMEGSTASWMIPLVSGGLTLITWLVIDWMLKKSSIKDVIGELKGFVPFPAISVILLVLSMFILLQTSLVMREFTEAVVSTVLPNTPPPIVALTFLVVIVYFGSKGLEAMTRASLLFFYAFISGMGLLLVLPLGGFQMVQLLPIWGNGIGDVLKYGVSNTSEFFQIIILVILLPAFKKSSMGSKVGIYSIVFSTVITVIFIVVLIGVFTKPMAEQMTYPMYQLSRVIYVSRFIQRLEAIFVFLWTSAAVIKMGFGLWISAYLYAYALKMPVYRPLLFALALVLYILSFLPPDLPAVLKIAGSVYEPFGGLITMILPLLMVGFIFLSKRKLKAGKGREQLKES